MSRALRALLGLERVAILHGALVLVTAACLRLPGGPPWLLTAPANLLLLLTLPSPLLAPLFLRAGRWLATGSQVAAAVVGLALFAVPVLEDCEWRNEEPARDEAGRAVPARLLVVSFNTGVGLARATRIAEFLEEVEPDLVVLVEVTDRLTAELTELCGERFPHRALYPGGIDGKAVFSRFPIRDEEWLRLEGGRPSLRVELDVDGRALSLIAVHFSPSIGVLDHGAASGRNLDRVSELLDPGGASILAGDFNTTERSPSHARLVEAGFVDSFQEAGSGLGRTFPMFGRYFGLPIGRFMRIDYVWHGAALRAERALVGPDLGSDHLPVVAELAWDTARSAR